MSNKNCVRFLSYSAMCTLLLVSKMNQAGAEDVGYEGAIVAPRYSSKSLTRSSTNTNRNIIKISSAEALTELQILHNSYFNSDKGYFGGEDTSNQVSTAGLDLNYKNDKGAYNTKIDLQGFYSFAEDYPYLNVREIYVEQQRVSGLYTLGRKKQKLSYSDDFWQTGYWQPRFTWDKLNTEGQGLTGFFHEQYELESKTRFLTFISLLHVPEQGAHFEIENGTLISKNPWFLPPPRKARVLQQDTTLTYSLKRPETADVLLSPGAGFRIDTQKTRHQNIGLAYSYKPMNQILASYDYRLRLSENDQKAPITIIPQFPYHHLATLDWSRETKVSHQNFSLTYERPERLSEDDQLISQQLREQFIMSYVYSLPLKGEGVRASRLYSGVIRSWGGYEEDRGDSFSTKSQFEIRQRWFEAYRVGFSHPIAFSSRLKPLRNNIEITYDRIQNGYVLTSHAEYALSPSFIISGSLDWLQVFDSRETDYDSSLMRNYRANDKIAARLRYVF